MEKEQVQQLKQIIDLFDLREQTYIEQTQKILEAFKPTVLDAVAQFLKIEKEDNIYWYQIDVAGLLLVLAGAVRHSSPEKVPDFLEKLSPPMQEATSDGSVQRLVKIGIPLHIIIKSKEEILEYLIKEIENKSNTGEQDQQPMQEDEQIFDNDSLTEEQTLALQMFQTQVKNTKH